mmetsp:Transcript_39926/g.120676  ORF Transcript_39926/g.120676 Transcript_39926/m.120676 type:complete len:219 (+) Transcript_39926:1418-2074(+)
MSCTSSLPLCASNTKSTFDHSAASFFSVASIFDSCLAWSAVSSTASENLWSSRFHMSRRRIEGDTLIDLPHNSINCVQCLGRIAGSFSSPTKGQNTHHFLMMSCMPMYASHLRSTLISFSFLKSAFMSSSMIMASISPSLMIWKRSVLMMRFCSHSHNWRMLATSSRIACITFFELFNSFGYKKFVAMCNSSSMRSWNRFKSPVTSLSRFKPSSRPDL